VLGSSVEQDAGATENAGVRIIVDGVSSDEDMVRERPYLTL
jgi:hypothetical protein